MLSARENRFAQHPFPHYAVIEPTADADIWLMRGTVFRPEGLLPASALRAASLRPSVAGAFALDSGAAHPTHSEDINAFYGEACNPSGLPLIELLAPSAAAARGGRAALRGRGGSGRDTLTRAASGGGTPPERAEDQEQSGPSRVFRLPRPWGWSGRTT